MKPTARESIQNKPKVDVKKSKKNKHGKTSGEDSSTIKGVSPRVKKMNDVATNISRDRYEFRPLESSEGNHKSSQVSESRLESGFRFANGTHVSFYQ